MRKIFSALAILCTVSVNAHKISYRDMSIIVTVPARTAIALKFEEKEQRDSDIKKAYSCAVTCGESIYKSFRADSVFKKPLILEGGYLSENRYTISFYDENQEQLEARMVVSCVLLKKTPEYAYRIKRVLPVDGMVALGVGACVCGSVLIKKLYKSPEVQQDNKELQGLIKVTAMLYKRQEDLQNQLQELKELQCAFIDDDRDYIACAKNIRDAERIGSENISCGEPTREEKKLPDSEALKKKMAGKVIRNGKRKESDIQNRKISFRPECQVNVVPLKSMYHQKIQRKFPKRERDLTVLNDSRQ